MTDIVKAPPFMPSKPQWDATVKLLERALEELAQAQAERDAARAEVMKLRSDLSLARDEYSAADYDAHKWATLANEKANALDAARAALDRARTQVALYEGRHPAQLGPDGREMSPRHRFGGDGICIRCGSDVESDTGCVEELRAALASGGAR